MTIANKTQSAFAPPDMSLRRKVSLSTVISTPNYAANRKKPSLEAKKSITGMSSSFVRRQEHNNRVWR
jgi:hypothetical protein